MNSQNPSIDARDFWTESRKMPAIDVRTPGEFDAGHIPGAINVPLFTDDERATVGTLYANQGHDAAVMEGLSIVGPKMSALAQKAQEVVAERQSDCSNVLVHCWRGGMRSQSMAWLMGVAGLKPRVLEGGYKSFRNLAQGFINRRWNLHVVSGLTGAGKTRILTALHQAGEQTCDLEALANHRGSAYGGIAQGDQPSTEQFENDLFACLDGLDPERRIWVEDEGNRIGRVVVPQTFYDQVRHAPAVFLDVDVERRVDNLMGDYQQLPVEGLVEATQKIRKRLGGQKTDHALAAIEAGDLQAAVETTLSYYDRTYTKAANKMPRAIMESLVTNGLNDDQIVDECLKLAETFELPAEIPAEGSRL
ncbi:tRNA 2-selenouridine(34) synthase MnmH [Mariniblastus sp.]|nr:tRNA 2-selenouridine(34) synthase MnmH [Mariniblastus sp.]